jgi:SM-20-related protein
LAPRRDKAFLAGQLAATGRVRVSGILDPVFAEALRAAMARWTAWARVTRVQGEHRSFDAEAMDRLDPVRAQAFAALVEDGARSGFQYLFDRYPLVDHGRLGRLQHASLLQCFALLRSQAFLELAQELLAEPSISFVDRQLTRYQPGHFLTAHDDCAPGLRRLAAYVINLSPDWPACAGGALEFLDDGGHPVEAWLPSFNTLSLFKVPAPHRVARVTAQAVAPRLAITGWFRCGAEPAVTASG